MSRLYDKAMMKVEKKVYRSLDRDYIIAAAARRTDSPESDPIANHRASAPESGMRYGRRPWRANLADSVGPGGLGWFVDNILV